MREPVEIKFNTHTVTERQTKSYSVVYLINYTVDIILKFTSQVAAFTIFLHSLVLEKMGIKNVKNERNMMKWIYIF